MSGIHLKPKVPKFSSALWHLELLIAARPDDWYLFARRQRLAVPVREV